MKEQIDIDIEWMKKLKLTTWFWGHFTKGVLKRHGEYVIKPAQ